MNIEAEIWKDIYIKGEKTLYEISSYGRVKTHHPYYGNRDRLKAIGDDGNGYCTIRLSHNSKKYARKIHRLVALYFISNPNNLPEVNHKNTDKKCNYCWNLEWTTKPKNAEHAGQNGRLSRGARKLPPIKVGKYFAGVCLKTYYSLGSVKKDGYPRISVTRAANSGKNYQGFFWKYITDAN